MPFANPTGNQHFMSVYLSNICRETLSQRPINTKCPLHNTNKMRLFLYLNPSHDSCKIIFKNSHASFWRVCHEGNNCLGDQQHKERKKDTEKQIHRKKASLLGSPVFRLDQRPFVCFTPEQLHPIRTHWIAAWMRLERKQQREKENWGGRRIKRECLRK